MTAHAAVARRRSDGWLRWGWHCPTCGGGEWVSGGKEAAEAAADAHNAPADVAAAIEYVRVAMTCDCYTDREFSDDRCHKCRLLPMLAGGDK